MTHAMTAEESLAQIRAELAAEAAATKTARAPKRRQDAPALTDRIRAAVANLAGPGEWVSLTRLRPLLGDTPRADVDEALRELGRQADVNLVPENNQKTLTDADRAAALHRGGQDVHLIAIW